MVTLSSLRQQVETQQGTTGLDSAQVSAISGSGVSVYETLDSLPSTGLTAGAEAFVKSNSRLYVSNGAGWYNTTLVNRNPRWDSGGEPDESYTIADSQTPLIITAKAIDSDNPDTHLTNQSIVSDSAQYMVDISNDSSVWTFTPKSADSIGDEVAAGNLTDSNGDFIYTFKWSDGISFISKAVTISYNAAGGGATNWDLTLSNFSYDNKSLNVGAQETSPFAFNFKPDGTKLYVLGNGSDILYQYGLTTPYDISTASYDNVSFNPDVDGAISYTGGLGFHWKSDGTSLYFLNYGADQLYQYDLSSVWDITTASYTNKYLNFSSQDTYPYAFTMSADGTKIFMTGGTGDDLYQYSLSTAWDLQTASYDNVAFGIHQFTSITSTPRGVLFNPEGTKFWVVEQGTNGNNNTYIVEYSCTSGFDLTTASYTGNSITTGTLGGGADRGFDIDASSDGTKFYFMDYDDEIIYQYSTGN